MHYCCVGNGPRFKTGRPLIAVFTLRGAVSFELMNLKLQHCDPLRDQPSATPSGLAQRKS